MSTNLEALPRNPTPMPKESHAADPGFPVAPILAFVALWLGSSGLVVGAWLHPVLPGGWATIMASLALIALPTLALVRAFRDRVYPSAGLRLFAFRPFWYAMLLLPVLAMVTLAGGLVGLPFGAAGTFGRVALGSGAVVLAGMVLAGYVGSRRLVVRRLEVQMPRLPTTFDGLRVVQISDLHVGPHTPRKFLERVAARIREERPDLLAITGDQVDDFAQDVEIFNQAFAGLETSLGSFAVAGNHDIYAGWDGVHRGLEAAGIHVLVNASVRVEREGQHLWIAGTGDPAAHSALGGKGQDAAPDIARTLAGIPPGEPVLALAHNPALWPALATRGVDLTLSGHTHYGQLAIPRLGWSMASPFLKLAMGAFRQGRSLLYINPGTNYWGIPFRLGTPPEVTILTLRADACGEASLSGA